MTRQYYYLISFVLNVLIYTSNCASQPETRFFEKSKVIINNENNVTLITNSDTVTFFAVGDSGGLPIWPYRTVVEWRVAGKMQDLAEKYKTQFQIGLGDNFYLNGVDDVNDDRFKETFEDVFDSKVLKTSPWFFIMGNHDHYGNAKAQIEYTKKSNRWITPSFNYSIDVMTSNGVQKLITILMINTISLCGNTPTSSDSSNQPKYASAAEEQAAKDYLTAFEKRLADVAATTVPYIIVAGHFPVWSVGEHGPTKCLIDKVRPLLHKYGVSAYFCGHDHDLQHIQETYLNKKVDYIVSGCANFNNYNKDHVKDVPTDSLKFYWALDSFLFKYYTGGFVLASASKSALELNFYDTSGKVLYKTTINPRF